MQYCTRCVYPGITATPLTFDENGVCSGCRVAEQTKGINWEERWQMLVDLTNEYRSGSQYDILIPVSGGKDSYFQTHVATKLLGLKPLLVTYHGNNYLPEGEYNLHRMREVFDCDHIIINPGIDVLIKMNRLGFKLQGDMNWHNHCGIFTAPIQIAVRYKVPLMMWGEHGFMDLGGMYSYNDFVEFTAKHRLEHSLRGYDWYDFTDEGLDKLGRPELKEGLTAKYLLWAQYPSDAEIDTVGVRGIYLSNFVPWDANRNYKVAKELYDWRPAQQPFERTYRTFSNLDDMHENGIHDYLKFIKLGYGRASDHANKDIRGGYMTREQGIEMVRKYDHVKPRRDLERWLKYVNMTEEEFDRICDTFRDRRVWRIENGYWVKDNIWGGASAYGPVHLKESKATSHRLDLRPAKEEDCEVLWQWRNEEDTRKWSFNTEYIPYEEHKKWFLSKLINADSLILIVSEGQRNIGQVRFDKSSDGSAEVYISISAAERHKGHGSDALKIACQYAVRKLNVTRMIAHIKDGNEASIGVFTRAGFVNKGLQEFKGFRVIEMLWDAVGITSD